MRINDLEKDWKRGASSDVPEVSEEETLQVVSGMWTGILATRLAAEETERLLHMESALHERIINKDSTMAKAVRRARAGLKDPRRPIDRSSSLAQRVGGDSRWLAPGQSSCLVSVTR